MHHYGRLKAVCLGTPADGGGWTIWKGNLCDNDAYCMSKGVWTPEYMCVLLLKRKEKKKLKKRWPAANRLEKTFSVREIWYMKSTCKSLLEGVFYVCIDQSLFTPIDADFVKCCLFSVWELTLSTLPFTALFSSSNLPCAENVIAVTVTCHFLFISTDDKAFYIEYSAPHMGIFDRSLRLLKDKCWLHSIGTSFMVRTKLASLFFKEMKKPLAKYSLTEKENLIFILCRDVFLLTSLCKTNFSFISFPPCCFTTSIHSLFFITSRWPRGKYMHSFPMA